MKQKGDKTQAFLRGLQVSSHTQRPSPKWRVPSWTWSAIQRPSPKRGVCPGPSQTHRAPPPNEGCCPGDGWTHGAPPPQTRALSLAFSPLCDSEGMAFLIWWRLRLGFPGRHRKSFRVGWGILPALRTVGNCVLQRGAAAGPGRAEGRPFNSHSAHTSEEATMALQGAGARRVTSFQVPCLPSVTPWNLRTAAMSHIYNLQLKPTPGFHKHSY